ncbi:thrombospondin type 3 repeat-containing protein [Sorangium sp. So ce269]
MGFNQSPLTPGGFPAGPQGDVMRRELEQFLLAFDSNMAPVVGQQVTLVEGNEAVVGSRIDLLMARAGVGECDLVVKGMHIHELEGFLYVGAGLFVSNRVSAPAIGDAALRQRAWNSGGELTYTCVPPGSGVRIGLDRDGDGFRDGDEEDEGSDPADAGSTPVP